MLHLRTINNLYYLPYRHPKETALPPILLSLQTITSCTLHTESPQAEKKTTKDLQMWRVFEGSLSLIVISESSYTALNVLAVVRETSE